MSESLSPLLVCNYVNTRVRSSINMLYVCEYSMVVETLMYILYVTLHSHTHIEYLSSKIPGREDNFLGHITAVFIEEVINVNTNGRLQIWEA